MSASNSRPRAVKRLPVNPSLENLRKQAKRLASKEPGLTLQQAQHRLAREYGSANWAELAQVVETMGRGASQLTNVKYEMQPLPAAANRSDLDAVRRILSTESFTQHDLDLALGRSVLRFSERRAIAELLVAHGADPDGQYGSNYGPIALACGECLDPDGLAFLIEHGADVTFGPIDSKYGLTSPMIATLGSYTRGANDRKHRCIDLLLKHDAPLPKEITPEMLAIHRGDVAELSLHLDALPSLVHRRFDGMPYGNMNLDGATLLHLAVEFGEIGCIDLLLDRGADINARAKPEDGSGDQTPIFHCIATCQAAGVPTLEHLLKRCRGTIDLTRAATFRATTLPEGAGPMTPLQWAERSRAEDVMSWRRASDREIEVLA
jgi:hypothetical protein